MDTSAGTTTPVVTLHVWRVPRGAVAKALYRWAVDRRRLRQVPGVRFAKLLGTGTGLGARGAQDFTRWAALVCWEPPGPPGRSWDSGPSPVHDAWEALAVRSCQLRLHPLASRGSWSGQSPFEPLDPVRPIGRTGPVVSITRTRLRLHRSVGFRRALGPVAEAAFEAPGLLAAVEMSEGPIGWQGTVSVWSEAADAIAFAYRDAAHSAAVARSAVDRWYAEELFARFALVDIGGDPRVIGWDRVPG